MKEDFSKELHEAAKILRGLLEKHIGKKAIVFYGATKGGDSEVHTGITLSDKIKSRDVEHLAFTLVSRARDMIDYGDIINPKTND